MSRKFALFAFVVLLFSLPSFAACSAPSQPGVKLCFPSVGATVYYPATMEIGVNTGNVPVGHVTVYDNGVRRDDFNYVPGTLVDYAIKNGAHNVTVNVWDVNGKLYQSKVPFYVTGYGYDFCKPSTTGVTICSPNTSTYLPASSAPVSFAVSSPAKVYGWSMWLDGSLAMTSAQSSTPTYLVSSVYAAPGAHTLTVKGYDAAGQSYTATRIFHTFYDRDCNPRTGACSPGIDVTLPEGFGPWGAASDVPKEFRLQASVMDNPSPTTAMKVYLDGNLIQQSNGPGITANVSTTAGAHRISIQAWDTKGKLYMTYGNINVQ